MRITKADLEASLRGLARRLDRIPLALSLETDSTGDGKTRYRVAAQVAPGSGGVVYPLGALYVVGASEAYDLLWRAINLLDFIEEAKRGSL